MKLASEKNRYIVTPEDTIHTCLSKIELNNINSLLVINNRKVVGSITDGDVRKSLINMRSLFVCASAVMNIDFVFASTRDDCANIFHKLHHINLVPIIDADRELIEIFLRY